MKTKHLLLVIVGLFIILTGWVTTAFTLDISSDREDFTISGNLTVFAAASLTDAFRSLSKEFSTKHPGAEIVFNFAGSQQLAYQIGEGAPADIFASANETQMAAAVASGRVLSSDVEAFAGNRLVVVTPKSNPGQIATLSDLSKPGVKLVLASEEAPIGHYTQAFLASTEYSSSVPASFSDQVLNNVVSFEQNARAVLSKVLLGEADAGIVYGSDAAPVYADRLSIVAIPDDLNITAAYPMAPLVDTAEPDLARAFIDFVRSAQGQEILADHGFLAATDAVE